MFDWRQCKEWHRRGPILEAVLPPNVALGRTLLTKFGADKGIPRILARKRTISEPARQIAENTRRHAKFPISGA